MKNLYSANEIKQRLTCTAYAADHGAEIRNGRTKAWWRNGDSWNVAIDDHQWYDHVTKQGGSVIDLCAVVEHGDIGATMAAMRTLGERLNLSPITKVKSAKKTRSEILLAEGYKATATYDYRDENGEVRYQIVRFEKDEYKEGEHKEFVHRTPDHEGLDTTTGKLIYNLPAVVKADEVFIVEGEKDANTLIELGLTATTNSGGASNWEQSFNKWFEGKNIIVICDNDEAGQKHGKLLVSLLAPVAKSIKSITPSQLPKGDVTDWIEKEGGSLQKLRDLLAASGGATATDTPEIAAAKIANERDFTNFRKEPSKGNKDRIVPLTIDEILADVQVRFLGYPRNLGGNLFDWRRDREKREVLFLPNQNSLFAWIQRVSHRPVYWQSGIGFVNKLELFESILQDAKKYNGLSIAPHFPLRDDVFYTYTKLPPPDPTHSAFWTLIDRFNPANEANRILIAAFFCAPMFYTPTATRPMWVIDTEDAQASGKTTVVKMCAHLYGHPPINIDLAQLERDTDQIIKRLISTEGRQARIALLDNVTKTLSSSNLATFVTDSYISGRPAYGRGEELRPNDITYVATVNGASVNTDMATRAYTIRIKKPDNPDPNWEPKTYAHIDDNQTQIFADILDLLRNNPNPSLVRKGSRFAKFDQIVLAAVCRNLDEFNAADAAIRGETEAANEDGDRAEEFMDLFEDAIAKSAKDDEIQQDNKVSINGDKSIFMLNCDIDYLLKHSDGALSKWNVANIWTLIKQGLCRNIVRSVQRLPHSTQYASRRGILYAPPGSIDGAGSTLAQILERRGNKFTVARETTIRVRKSVNDDIDEDIPF